MSWFKRVFVKKSPSDNDGDISPELGLVGRIALAITPLRTSGYIELDGVRYEVISHKGFVPVNSQVRITGKRMGWLTVEPIDPISETPGP